MKDIDTSLTQEELMVIEEIACMALGDADMFDMIAEDLDLSDTWLKALQEKLNERGKPID